jgi:23S rRNA U2552 (ribose-2'-O)-methylase RlmE/FtsJ
MPVVDLGAAPGGSMSAVELAVARPVIASDILPMDPPSDVDFVLAIFGSQGR